MKIKGLTCLKVIRVSLLKLISGTRALNVAVDMTASTRCDVQHTYKKLFDTDYLNSEWVDHCKDHPTSYFVVHLQEKYSIQYVVLYPGNREEDLNKFH